jgi:4-cresol dehydrogenase (hydroxylating)
MRRCGTAKFDSILDACKEWAAVVGEEHVSLNEQELLAAQTATFATNQRVSAIVRPGNREEVQQCVLIAGKYRTPLYPVSTGKNWGYGSRVPPSLDSVILSLERMNRILDFNEKLAYITVEPGVTFAHVYQFLKERHSSLTINSPGSTPHASLIGHVLERGIVGGLNGERCREVCAFEVVLPNGECLQTGMDRYSKAQSTSVSPWGVGPSFDGLFSQSNLGIVTKLTVWLTPLPKFFQYFSFQIGDPFKLSALVDKLQCLKRDGLIETSCGLYNHYKVLSYSRQYPWTESEGLTPLPDELLPELLEKFSGGAWFGEAALTAPCGEIGEVKQKIVRQELSALVDRISFAPANAENPLIGSPLETGLASVYWRKKTRPPEIRDPDGDQCGVIWCSLVVPFSGEAVSSCLQIIEEEMRSFRFEPIVGIQCLTIRAVYLVASIVYDRQQPGQDEAASECEKKMLSRLTREGFFPYRLNINTMNALHSANSTYVRLLKAFKQIVDPWDILAAGRYDFRHEWPD